MQNDKPFIGLSSQYNDERTRLATYRRYADVISDSGGIPLFLPELEGAGDIAALAEKLDGLFLTGGDDINPALYGEEKQPDCGSVSDSRDRFELAILAEAYRLGKPILGVCRGIQVINVGFGGTLFQHIEGHRNTKHTIKIIPGENTLHKIYRSESAEVNSYHHQAVKRLGKGLKAVATAEIDGIVEGVWLPGYRFLLGVQWHPEVSYSNDGMKSELRVFQKFVDACR